MKIRIINNVFFKTIGLAALFLVILVFGLLWALNKYTHHGEAVIVPDVKGLQMEAAIPFFQHANLRYEIVDSIHVKNAKPGSIVELIPPANSKVKADRIIFIKINSFSVETFILPEVKDASLRVAMANLRTSGFENVQTKTVSSPHKDLVLGVEYNGREVYAGDKIPSIGELVLKVGSGEEDDENDSTHTLSTEDNSWF